MFHKIFKDCFLCSNQGERLNSNINNSNIDNIKVSDIWKLCLHEFDSNYVFHSIVESSDISIVYIEKDELYTIFIKN